MIEETFNKHKTNADVILVNGEAFMYKASGLTRRVYANASKTKVIKVCLERGNFYNEEEYEIYSTSDEIKRTQIAETELLSNGYIMQEYLHTFDDEETHKLFPRLTMKQIEFAKSCREDVGFDKDGNLKCFDLAEFKSY